MNDCDIATSESGDNGLLLRSIQRRLKLNIFCFIHNRFSMTKQDVSQLCDPCTPCLSMMDCRELTRSSNLVGRQVDSEFIAIWPFIDSYLHMSGAPSRDDPVKPIFFRRIVKGQYQRCTDTKSIPGKPYLTISLHERKKISSPETRSIVFDD